MPAAPPLDSRSREDLIAQTEALATAYTAEHGSWRPINGSLDFGGALVRVFAGMLERLLRQLNRVPEKHQLAFTQLLGARRIPARAARVPVTFRLVDGVATAQVPALARVAGKGPEGEAVFETESPLALTRAELRATFVQDVSSERYADRTPIATGAVTGAFDALAAVAPPTETTDPLNRAIEHELYFSLDALLALPGVKSLSVRAQAVGNLPGEAPAWSAWGNGKWNELSGTRTTNEWRLDATPAQVGSTEVNGQVARWVRAALSSTPPPLTLSTEAVLEANAQVALDGASFDGARLDLERDVLPFGERPRLNDVFYLGSAVAFSLPGVDVTLAVELANSLSVGAQPSGDLVLQWEGWDGRAWAVLGKSSTEGFDGTKGFRLNGAIRLRFQTPLALLSLGGLESRWLRVRIVAGNYGTEPTFRPPIISSLKLTWQGRAPQPFRLLRRTAQSFEDLSTEAAKGPLQTYLAKPELLHQSELDADSSLQLGFDRPLAGATVSLFFQVLPPPAVESDELGDVPKPPLPMQLQWEYWNGSWSELGVEDDTRHFASSGPVRFAPPPDAQPLLQFGTSLYWVRARLTRDEVVPMPRLGRILTNTVWAVNASTRTREVLGGSSGARNQVFRLPQAPVLEGQQIEVGEPAPLPSAELARLAAEEGADPVTVESGPGGSVVHWVRWHEVADFWASGPRDRHYTLDVNSGEITFGDGTAGMIPPAGSQNIRAARYQAGGGTAGNVAESALTQLKTTVPGVQSVSNSLPAVGGAAAETTEALADRAARTIRHGGRAVAAEDFADLALESSTAVARAVTIPPFFPPIGQSDNPLAGPTRDGQVLVAIVPASTEPGTSPPTDLLAQVESYLRERCAPGALVQVVGPRWVATDITVKVAPARLEDSAAVIAATQHALAELLDPLRGGDGRGWEFGRRPYRSDLITRIHAIDGVDHVAELDVRFEKPWKDKAEFEEAENDDFGLRGRLLAYARSIQVSTVKAGGAS